MSNKLLNKFNLGNNIILLLYHIIIWGLYGKIQSLIDLDAIID